MDCRPAPGPKETLMKIGSMPPVTPAATDPAASGTARSAGTTGAPAGAAAIAGGDQVQVSAAAVRMNALSQSADFDAAKVDAIRQAIREGRFSINAGAIADRLIADATALLGPRTH